MHRAHPRLIRAFRLSLAAAMAAALAFGAAAPPAAATPYFLKLDGVDGEAKGHGGWIEIQSVNWGSAKPARTGAPSRLSPGGGAGGSAPSAGGEHEIEYTVEPGKAPPAGPGAVTSGPSNPQPVGLLVPAIQKVREAAIKGSYPGCRVGARHDQVTATDSRGRRIVLRDVEIRSCADGQIGIAYRSSNL